MSPRRSSLGILLITGMFAAGCGVGLHSETDKEHATPYIANASAGPVSVHAVRIVLASGSATNPNGPQAYLSATFVNSGDSPDTLTGATIAGGAVQSATGGGVNVDLPAKQLIQLGEPDLGLTSGAVLGVGALANPLQAGTTETVTFTFQNAGTTTVDAPVLDATDVGTTASAAPVSASG